MELKSWALYGIIGVAGVAVTYLLATPATYEVSIGMLRFNPYYVAMTGFIFFIVIGVLDLFGMSIPEKYYHPKVRK